MDNVAEILGFVMLAAFLAVFPSGNATSQGELPIPLTIIFPEGAVGPVPVTVGVPLFADTSPSEGLTVVGPAGPIPTQVREVSRLGTEGQTTWLLVDFQAEPGAVYSLDEGARPSPSVSVTVTPNGAGGVVVDSGAVTWEIPATSNLLANVTDAGGQTLVTGASWGVAAVPAEVEVVEEGPLRAMVRVRGQEAVRGLDLTARLHFYAGLPYARVRITLTNHNRALTWAEAPDADNGECSWPEEGQPACNGLLSPNGIAVEDVTWALSLADPPSGPAEVLYQDSSGTDRWNYYAGVRDEYQRLSLGPVHRMQADVTFRGFRHTRGGEVVNEGDIADGTLVAGGVRLDVPWFRELFPKALRVRSNRLEFGVFPGEFSTVHRLRAGEQKTHDIWISLDPTVQPPGPVYASPEFNWLRATGALGFIGPRVEGRYEEYEAYLDAQFDDSQYTRDDCNNDLSECATSIFDARRRWDYFGWTDFGDVPTDFENPRSPYNLKYDMNLGFLYQALRTADVRWWELAHAADIHFADIDILHTRKRGYDMERMWWEGGSWGHSYHNEEGLTNPHRNCANPSPDTCWGVAGMAAWTLLTGDDVVREAAIELADNTLWRALNTADTECARNAWGGGNGEGYMLWEEIPPPARPVANTQRILVWAWRLTGDRAYLDGAAGAARWYQCESERFTGASWPEALLARSMAEYVFAAQDAGMTVDPAAQPALMNLLQAMADPSNLTRDGDRAWFSSYTGEEINAWMFLAADAFAYGYALTSDRNWLDEYARPCFNTASRDPYYEGDTSQYHTMKELANTAPNGIVFLHFADVAAGEFRITQVAVDSGGALTLAWSSLPGRTYSVHRSNDMITWEPAADSVPSAGEGVTTWVDPTTPLPLPEVRRRYYKVRENE